ncbi:MAG TPA: hypothetical protein VIV11_35520 [Kofleriaceae bacterium]
MREDDLEPEDRALVAKLKQLPPEGNEPDWQQLEASIRAEVGDRAPRPWWRNWRWIVPVWALATTAVIALLVLRDSDPVEHHAVIGPTRLDAGVVETPAPPAPTAALWLDGEVVELDEVAESTLDELDGEARAALAPEGDVTGGILPVADYGWVDALDEEALVAAEDWLKRNRS